MIGTFQGVDVALVVDDEWLPVEDEFLHRWRHPSGLELTARWREGARPRLEIDVIPTSAVAMAPAPRLEVTSQHALVPWLGGASGEIIALTSNGPIAMTQQRGYASGALPIVGILPEPLVVAPGHPAASTWVFEAFEGDLITAPPEPTWFPARRHVPLGDDIELHLPDSVVTGIAVVEIDDGYLLENEPGLHTIQIGGPRGITNLEVGWSLDWAELVRDAQREAPDDLWCHLATVGDGDFDVDEFDVRLARALEAPTLWALLAASRAPDFGLPEVPDLAAAARRIADQGDVPTKVALFSWGLADVSQLVGAPLGRIAFEGLQEFGLGRVMSHYPDGAERQLVPAWFWLAGLGESELAARVGGMVGLIQARALCRASETLDPEAVAWLSLNT